MEQENYWRIRISSSAVKDLDTIGLNPSNGGDWDRELSLSRMGNSSRCPQSRGIGI